MDPISKGFVAEMGNFAEREGVPVVQFRKGERKDDIAAEHLKRFTKAEGVLFIGKAQTPVWRCNALPGGTTRHRINLTHLHQIS